MANVFADDYRTLRDAERETAPSHGSFMLTAPLSNPDTKVETEGISVYREAVESEARIKAGLDDLVMGILSPGFEVRPPKGFEDQLEDAAEFCEEDIKELGGRRPDGSAYFDTPEQALDTMGIVGLSRGFYVGETVWRQDGTALHLDMVKSKDPEHVEFRVDEFGNLLENGVIIDVGTGSSPHSLNNLVVWSVGQKFGNPYGSSLIRQVWRAYWLKDLCYRCLGIIAERYAGGAIVGTYEARHAGKKGELLTMLRQLQREGVAVLPEGVSFTVKELVSNSVNVLQRTISEQNEEISIALTGQSLATQQGQGGSMAQSTVHAESREMRIRFYASLLERVISEQVIRPICDRNFATVTWKRYPEFRFKSRDQVDTHKLAEESAIWWNIGVEFITDDLYEKIGATKPDGAPEVIGKLRQLEAAAAIVPAGSSGPIKTKAPQAQGNVADGTQATSGFAEINGAIEALVSSTEPVTFQDEDESSPDEGDYEPLASSLDSYNPRRYWKRLDSLIAQAMDEREDWGELMIPRVRELYAENAEEWAANPKLLNGLGSLPLWGAFRSRFKKLWTQSGRYGETTATAEIAEAAEREGEEFADADESEWADFDFEKTMDDWEGHDAAAYRSMMRDAAMAGMSPDEMIATFGAWWEGREAAAAANAYSEFARAFNSARMETYRESKQVKGVRYDAVMDDRTTPICEGLHGTWIELDSVGAYQPPNHYRCRSVLTPAFRWETVTLTTTPEDSVPSDWKPQAGFGAPAGNAPPTGGA